MELGFLKDFNKQVDKMDGVGRSSSPPRFWYHTGNHVLNKIISGSYMKGIPQGRITVFAGPSASGKSFLTGNVIREAQKAGAFILVVDSENALDDAFMTAIGVDTTKNYSYVSVVTIAQAQNIISSFLKGYKKEYGNAPDAPEVLICLDSLSMLLTDTELENYDKGTMKGDMGQRNKQLKSMLRTFVQDIKDLNVTMTVTTQVYANQNPMDGNGVWVVPDAIRYSASQIVLTTKLKLRSTEAGSRDIDGIRMKCEGFKTRFTAPFQVVTIEVPYARGMDPYNGLLKVAEELKVVEKRGSRYVLAGEDSTWYAKDFDKYAADVLVKCEAMCETFLEGKVDEEDEDHTNPESATSQRKRKVSGDGNPTEPLTEG